MLHWDGDLRAAKVEPWLASRTTYFESTDYGDSVSSAEQKLTICDAFAAKVGHPFLTAR